MLGGKALSEMRLSERIVRRKKLVIIIWVIALLGMVPAILNYSHFVSYSTGSSSQADTESAKAQAILSGLSPQNSSLIVVVESNRSMPDLANRTLQFQNALEKAKIPFFSSSASAFSAYAQFLNSVMGQVNGTAYVEANGLNGAPAFVTKSYVSQDNSTYLVNVDFNVTESYRTSANVYPAQNATPEVRALAQAYFGGEAQVTGQGAVAYDTQTLTSGSGFVFAFTFVFLAIAVAVTLASILPPLFALLFVSLSTALGYVSIYVTGLLLGHVDFTVTYTLTAVLLGVSVDYLVFFLSRYREELRKGAGNKRCSHRGYKQGGLRHTRQRLDCSRRARGLVPDLRLADLGSSASSINPHDGRHGDHPSPGACLLRRAEDVPEEGTQANQRF